jgi:hypothetical protein
MGLIMNWRIILLLLIGLVCLAGCGTESMLIGTNEGFVFIVMDGLALPGEEIQLQARLEGGDFMQPQSGFVVRFYRDGKLFKATETDDDGLASVSFTPEEPGDYAFTVDVAPYGMKESPPDAQEILITCCRSDDPMVVVDMDKTLVASGFHTVLIGDPKPAEYSQEVMQRLAESRVIVYLTHRPDYFGVKSKKWLQDNQYPDGPVLLSSLSGFLKGSGTYKTEKLRHMREKFKRIEIGIGDKISDVMAYHENQIRSFLILLEMDKPEDPQARDELAMELEKLPEEIQVVTNWKQIEQALYEKEDHK